MPYRIYALGDVHGHYGQLATALGLIDLEHNPEDTLVLLGDYIDRGPSSAACLYRVKELAGEFPDRVIVLLGNHETDFLEWLDADHDSVDWLLADQGLVTTGSFLSPDEVDQVRAILSDDLDIDPLTRANAAVKHVLRSRHGELIGWLRNRPLVHETPDQIFVHAGIEEDLGEDWRLGTADHVFVGKWPAVFGSFCKTIVAGHVGTQEMHHDGSHGVYFDGHSHYYLDGTIEKTGILNVLRYDSATGRYSSFTVANEQENA